MNLSDYLYKPIITDKKHGIIVKNSKDHYIMIYNFIGDNKLVFLNDGNLKLFIRNFDVKVDYNCSDDDKRFFIKAIYDNA